MGYLIGSSVSIGSAGSAVVIICSVDRHILLRFVPPGGPCFTIPAKILICDAAKHLIRNNSILAMRQINAGYQRFHSTVVMHANERFRRAYSDERVRIVQERFKRRNGLRVT